MNCTEFQTRLNDEFDGPGAGPVPELVAHAAENTALFPGDLIVR